MQAVILMGIPASGKSSFVKSHFFDSHLRVSMDLLKTRHRERQLMQLCLETNQPFVVDNTNPARTDRERYIAPAREKAFSVVGYYFQSQVVAAKQRNADRCKSVPDVAIHAIAKNLELPSLDEGFDELYYVQIVGNQFKIDEWIDEV